MKLRNNSSMKVSLLSLYTKLLSLCIISRLGTPSPILLAAFFFKGALVEKLFSLEGRPRIWWSVPDWPLFTMRSICLWRHLGGIGALGCFRWCCGPCLISGGESSRQASCRGHSSLPFPYHVNRMTWWEGESVTLAPYLVTFAKSRTSCSLRDSPVFMTLTSLTLILWLRHARTSFLRSSHGLQEPSGEVSPRPCGVTLGCWLRVQWPRDLVTYKSRVSRLCVGR